MKNYQATLTINVSAHGRAGADTKIWKELEDTINFEDKGLDLLFERMRIEEVSEGDKPVATYQLCWADVEPTLTERGLTFSGLSAEQKADITHFTQKGMDAYMDGWQDIIDEAVKQALK